MIRPHISPQYPRRFSATSGTFLINQLLQGDQLFFMTIPTCFHMRNNQARVLGKVIPLSGEPTLDARVAKKFY